MPRNPRTPRKKSSAGVSDDRYWFDEEEADRAVAFIEELCCFDQACRTCGGESAEPGSPRCDRCGYSGHEPFVLQPWQKDFIRTLFGTKRRDNGCRRYRIVFMSMGRGNGKTPLMAAVGAYLLFSVVGAQLFSCAADREQAAIVVTDVKKFINASPALKSRCEILRNSITIEKRGSFWRVLSGRVAGKHGLRPLGVFFDELHEQKSRHLWDALYTARGKNLNSLVMAVTTAGFDRKTVCYEQYDRARKVKSGAIVDEEFLPVIYEPDEGDDWREMDYYRKSNPNLGVTVMEEYVRSEVQKAIEQPALQNTVRRLMGNEWTNQEHRAIDMAKWAACGERAIDLAALSKRPCWVGIDLSSKEDLTSATLVFPMDDGSYVWLSKSWLPERNLTAAAQRKGVDLELWKQQGYLATTPGGMIDYEAIRKELDSWREFYDVQKIIFDPWRDAQIAASLMSDGFTVEEYPARPSKMNEPTRYVLALINTGRILHGNDPILTWNAGNLVTKADLQGFIRPVKDEATPTQGIDAIFAGILGTTAPMVMQQSIYERRGPLVVG